MKKKLLTASVCAMLFLSGCGEKIINEQGEKVNKLGNFIEIKKIEGTFPEGHRLEFYLVYDKDTKVMYLLNDGYGATMPISPYYVRNKNGEVEHGVYGVNYP